MHNICEVCTKWTVVSWKQTGRCVKTFTARRGMQTACPRAGHGTYPCRGQHWSTFGGGRYSWPCTAPSSSKDRTKAIIYNNQCVRCSNLFLDKSSDSMKRSTVCKHMYLNLIRFKSVISKGGYELFNVIPSCSRC